MNNAFVIAWLRAGDKLPQDTRSQARRALAALLPGGLAKVDEHQVDHRLFCLAGTDRTEYPSPEVQSTNSGFTLTWTQHEALEKPCDWSACIEFEFLPQENRIRIRRDPIGNRTVCWSIRQDGETEIVWFAPREDGLLAIKDISSALDQDRLKRLFALRDPKPDQTYFSQIKQVRPGSVTTFSHEGVSHHRYWNMPWRYAKQETLPESQWADQLRRQLLRSTKRCIGNAKRVSVAVSGGMDSPAVAWAARQLCLERKDLALSLVSYRFKNWPKLDESSYAQELANELGLPIDFVDCDQLAPFQNSNWLNHLAKGEAALDAYRSYRHAIYDQLKSRDTQVLLTGDFGDLLYCHHSYDLSDLMRDRKWRALFQGITGVRWCSPRAWLADPSLRKLLPGLGLRRTAVQPYPEWMREYLEPLPAIGMQHEMVGVDAGRYRAESMINAWLAHCAVTAEQESAPWQLANRFPLRDLEMVQFMANVPAYLLNGDTQDVLPPSKYLMRLALREHLPESIIMRPDKTAFTDHLRLGLFNLGQQQVANLLESEDAIWPQFVKRNNVQTWFKNSHLEDPELLILWYCLALEIWRKNLPDFA